MTNREKMLAGELYDPFDPELVAGRLRARELSHRYNAANPRFSGAYARVLRELIGSVGEGAHIEPPFYCDYGTNIELGAGVFVNLNCVFLDCARITIGAQTMLGPNVQLLTPLHPLDAAERVKGPEYAKPIAIGSRVWIGGGAIVAAGVTIGDDTTIGAGSVVVRDIPPGVLAVGNPCRVVRRV
jgi:maltose O-acetyltransferase